jgi:hypothetical protein
MRKAPVENFSQLIGLWPKPFLSNFAADIGVPYVTANMMRQRNSIAARYWASIVEAAEKRGIEGVTIELLAELARQRDLERAAS